MKTSSQESKSQIIALASQVMIELTELRPYISDAAATGSIYIKFRDERLRSLRISDHEGIARLKYRWNLRSDIERTDYLVIDGGMRGGVPRFYYQWEDWRTLCKSIFIMATKLPYLVDIDQKTGEDIPPLEGQKVYKGADS